MELKWTNKEPYERSRRLKPGETIENPNFSKEVETNAYSNALNHDEHTWDILNQSSVGVAFKVSNKREELDNKIADRQLVQQIGYNPFLGNNDYVTDIAIRDQFLKPINTKTETET
jgi:hypothetical protein